MQFELLLAWESDLNLFPRSVLTFSEWFNKSCEEDSRSNCSYMDRRLKHCRQDGEMDDLFNTFPHPTHLAACRIAHRGVMLKAGWSI